MKIGTVLRQLRISLKLRQEDICKTTNIDQSKLSRIEKYDQVASFQEICLLCDALNITPEKLWAKVKDEYIGIKLKEGGAGQQTVNEQRGDGRAT